MSFDDSGRFSSPSWGKGASTKSRERQENEARERDNQSRERAGVKATYTSDLWDLMAPAGGFGPNVRKRRTAANLSNRLGSDFGSPGTLSSIQPEGTDSFLTNLLGMMGARKKSIVRSRGLTRNKMTQPSQSILFGSPEPNPNTNG